MATWTVIGKARSGIGNSFGVTLDTDKLKWTVGGVGASDFFNTKTGSYVMKTSPANETILMDGAKETVANFRNLNSGTAVGEKGLGHQQETAKPFDWTLHSK